MPYQPPLYRSPLSEKPAPVKEPFRPAGARPPVEKVPEPEPVESRIRFALTIEALATPTDEDGNRRLRALLRTLHCSFGFRCVSAGPVAAD